MTYNQIIKRVKGVCLAHRQIRNFYRGVEPDFLTKKTTLYPSSFLEENSNNAISISSKVSTFSFKMFLLDLVNVSSDAKENELDVLSDMSSIAIDLVALLSNPIYTDWRISVDDTKFFRTGYDNDMLGGVEIDFTISIPFTKDICQAPTEDLPIPVDLNSKEMYDLTYITNGTEGNTLTIPALAGKKILLITRESSLIYKVSNNPNTTEYTWDLTDIVLGLEVNTEADPGERFLILYRNF